MSQLLQLVEAQQRQNSGLQLQVDQLSSQFMARSDTTSTTPPQVAADVPSSTSNSMGTSPHSEGGAEHGGPGDSVEASGQISADSMGSIQRSPPLGAVSSHIVPHTIKRQKGTDVDTQTSVLKEMRRQNADLMDLMLSEVRE